MFFFIGALSIKSEYIYIFRIYSDLLYIFRNVQKYENAPKFSNVQKYECAYKYMNIQILIYEYINIQIHEHSLTNDQKYEKAPKFPNDQKTFLNSNSLYFIIRKFLIH